MSRENPTIAEYDDALTRIASLRAALDDMPGEPFKLALFEAGVPIENVIAISYEMGQMHRGQLWNAEMFLKSMREFKMRELEQGRQ